MEQMSLFPLLTNEEDAEDLKGQMAVIIVCCTILIVTSFRM